MVPVCSPLASSVHTSPRATSGIVIRVRSISSPRSRSQIAQKVWPIGPTRTRAAHSISSSQKAPR